MECREVPVVGYGFLRLLPDIFHCVELGRIRRQAVEFNQILFAFQPLTNLRSLVIRDMVNNQMDSGSVVVANKLLDESYERIGVEPL